MLIVGELINTSRPEIAAAVEKKDADYIKEIARKQVEAGADYVDVNCGSVGKGEDVIMQWLVETVQSEVDAPLCIDSPDPAVIEVGLSYCKKGQPMINSITAEQERYDAVLPIILKYKAKIVGLCMDDTGIPNTAEERLVIADKLIMGMSEAGVPQDDMYLDPLIKPVSTSDLAGMEVLDAIRSIRTKYPEVHGICGLSNISYGLPGRKILNHVFMIQTMTMKMDGYILDPLDKEMMGLLYASRTLLGQDKFCKNYLKATKKGLYK